MTTGLSFQLMHPSVGLHSDYWSQGCLLESQTARRSGVRPVMCIFRRPACLVVPRPLRGMRATILSMAQLDSRLLMWIIIQQHTYFGGFVLALPIFCVLLEFLGLVARNPGLALRYDGLAQDLLKVALLGHFCHGGGGKRDVDDVHHSVSQFYAVYGRDL